MNAETRTNRILLLEDSPLDAELIQEHLRRAGLFHRIHRVQTKAEFTEALKENYDLIIADYVLPSFDGLAALDIAAREAPATPFILVSGTLDEETATEAMRKGATDFVTKQRLKRLPAAVMRTMAEVTERRARQRAEEALRATEENYRLAIRAARLGIWRHDLISGDITLDAAALRHYGFSEQPSSLSEVAARIHPNDLQGFKSAFEAALDPARKGQVDVEYRVVLPKGGFRWLSVFGAVHFTLKDGIEVPDHALGTVQDVTERKEAEEKIHFLMREVNHRSKNLLSVVQSIARQTANSSAPGSFVQRFSQRLQGLAASHDLLVRNAWQGVSIADLVTAQLSHFRDHIGRRIRLDGPEIRLNSVAAQSLGMALHELGTNAAKYGGLSNDGGSVLLSWRVNGEGEAQELELSWTERDGPRVFPPVKSGLGTRIITDLTARALHGEVDVRYEDDGLTWRLTAPMEQLVEG